MLRICQRMQISGLEFADKIAAKGPFVARSSRDVHHGRQDGPRRMSGRALELEIESPTGHAARTILAAVVHVTTRPGNEWALGCNFIRELEPADLHALTNP